MGTIANYIDKIVSQVKKELEINRPAPRPIVEGPITKGDRKL
jgi:hypothetical protein